MNRTKKKIKKNWTFSCSGKDNKHGCFSADFDGVCSSYWGSRNRYTTEEKAIEGGLRHEKVCQFHGKTYAKQVQKG